MKRAILVALGTGALITSAAALSMGGGDSAPTVGKTGYEIALARQGARERQRAQIDSRYQSERASCDGLGGYRREKCLVKAHANRGRAMLAEAAPYQARD